MDFADKVKALAERIPNQLSHIQTEEATKNALIMPFINMLGYNVFDPTEVVPEFTADVGIKKGEKVDYTVMKEGKPSMLFECKTAGSNLSTAHASQLFRYFAVTDARIAVLANGVEYRFFTDLEAPNKMDSKPFLILDMLNLQDALILELKKLSKESFDLDQLLDSAFDLKYIREIRRLLGQQLEQPTDDFVRLFVSEVYSGRITQNVLESYRGIVKKAFNQFITEKINTRLQTALSGEGNEVPQIDVETQQSQDTEEIVETDKQSKIVTTEEELEAFHIVKAILRQDVEPERIAHRDTQSYFGVLLDDNNRKPICRFHFFESTKYLTCFDENREPYRVDVAQLNDIYEQADVLKNTLQLYI